MSCSECGIGQIVEDNFGAEVTMVCDNCGCMQKSELLVSTANPNYELKSLERKYHVSLDQHQMRWFQPWKNLINTCIDKFANDNEAIKKNAEDLFLKMVATKHKNFGRRRRLLAAACAYLALRQFEIPISVLSITREMETSSVRIHRVIQTINKITGDCLPPQVEEAVRMSLNGLPCMKSSDALTNKAMEIYTLLDRFSLVDGRMPSGVAAACAFFAVISKEKTPTRDMSNVRFCNNNGIPLHRTSDLLKVVRPRIILLAKRLPFVKASFVTERNFHLFIDDILRYQDTLFSNFEEEDSSTSGASLCIPPSLQRKMKYELPDDLPEVSTSEVLCEEDIPESEIGLYVRTTDEVTQAECIKQLLQSRTNES